MTETLVVDDLIFELKWSDARSTVGITVERDGSLTVTAPTGCRNEVVERAVEEKLFWIYSKLAMKDIFLRKRRSREFVSGESFFYLGKPYRLNLLDNEQPGTLRFRQRRFILSKYERNHAKKHFISWYTERAHIWLWRRTELFAERVGRQPEGIYIQDLDHRWGACNPNGIIAFHWQSITLPPTIVDYLVVHELAHLIERNHSREFWQTVGRIMPDYLERKRWLAENAIRYLL